MDKQILAVIKKTSGKFVELNGNEIRAWDVMPNSMLGEFSAKNDEFIESGFYARAGLSKGVYVKGPELKLAAILDKLEKPEIFSFSGDILADIAKGILTVSCAISKDDCRYFMQGVCIDKEGANLVATDGRRLYQYKLANMGRALPFPDSPILPVSKALLFLLEKYTLESLTLSGNDRQARVAEFVFSNGFKYRTTSIEGNFPNWRRVLPEYNQAEIDTVEIPSREELERVKLVQKINKEGKAGYFFTVLDTAKGNKVKFNIDYLLDALPYVNHLEGVEPNRAWQAQAENLRIVIMPMMLD